MEDVRGLGLQPSTAEENTDGFNCLQIITLHGLKAHYSCTHTGTLPRVRLFFIQNVFFAEETTKNLQNITFRL